MDLVTASDMKIKAKGDTGAQANIMLVYVYDKIVGTRNQLKLSSAHL